MKPLAPVLLLAALASCKETASAPAAKPKAEPAHATSVAPPVPAMSADQTALDAAALKSTTPLIEHWRWLQEQGAFDSYIDMYAPDFVGTKRTTDGLEKVYALDAWRADRFKMFAHQMTVAVEDLRVTVHDDELHARFLQRWKSGRYADHGEKMLILRNGKIVREEMLWSSPGWDDDRKLDALDMTDRKGPFTLRLEVVEPDTNGDCNQAKLLLHVDDATGSRRTATLTDGLMRGNHTTNDPEDPPLGFLPPARNASTLFDLHHACEGAGQVHLTLERRGDIIQLLSDEHYWEETPSTSRRVAVRLPPSAILTAR